MTTNQRLYEESTPTTSSVASEPIVYRRLWWAGLLAAIVAAVANVIVFLIEKSVFNLPMLVATTPGAALAPLSLTMVIIVSVVTAIVATFLLALLGRFFQRPFRWFWIIAVIVLLLSFLGPFSVPTEMGTRIALGVMHIVAAVVIVGLLTTLPRPQAE